MDTAISKPIYLCFALFFGITGALPLAHADPQGSWHAPSDGFLIQLSTPSGIQQKSGQTAQIAGKIIWIGGHKPEGTPGWDDSKHDSDVLSTLFREDGVQIKAFFPDATTDVTDQVKLSYSRNAIDVQYTTPALQTEVPSALILVVSHQDPSVRALQQVEAKLNVRIAALQAKIAFLKSENDSADDIAWLQSAVTNLQALSARIEQKIMSGNEILAEQRFPLQVDNLVAGSSMNSSLIEPFRFTVSYDLGSAIQGESTIAHGSIMRDVTDPEPKGLGGGYWVSRFFWNGTQVRQLAKQQIAPGAQIEFDFSTGALEPGSENTFSESLTSADHDDGGDWDGDKWWERSNFFGLQGGGALSFNLPVAADTIPPALIASQPAGNVGFVQAAPKISATFQDAFGLINPGSVHATLTGTTIGGAPVNLDLTGSLSTISPDQGQTYEIVADLSSLALSDGSYSFSMELSNFAGEAAAPFVVSFSLDRTPPTIQFGVQNNLLTNKTSFALPVSIVAESPTKTDITLNGTVVYSSNNLSFSAPLTLQQGANTVIATSTDSAGNEASSQITITLSTTPPDLGTYSPPDGSIISGLSAVISGQTDQQLSAVTVNGTAMGLSSSQKSFSGTYNAPTYGPATLVIT